MSRHRNVRNMKYEDYACSYEDDYDLSCSYGSYDESTPQRSGMILGDFLEPSTKSSLPEYQQQILDNVKAIIGNEFCEEEIVAALRQQQWNEDNAIDYLFASADAKVTQQNDSNNSSSHNGTSDFQFDFEMDSAVPINKDLPHNNNSNKKPSVVIVKQSNSKKTSKNNSNAVRVQTSKNTKATSAHNNNSKQTSNSNKVASNESKPTVTRKVKQMGASRKKEVLRLLQEKADNENKDSLNLVVIGHVDAGKSTTMGHLLYLIGGVDSRTMHKFEKESKETGKGSFAFAWILDAHEEERSRGITMDVAVNYFETERKKITLLDAPGHRDFVPNMISGAAQAEAGILLVDARSGEFERGFQQAQPQQQQGQQQAQEQGQTKEHALLASCLGVSQLIVAVNKLDDVQWSKQRYDSIVSALKPFLKQAGFSAKAVRYIPISGLTGDNLVSKSKQPNASWYDGPTLIELIDTFAPPTRLSDKPFRLCVSDVYKSTSLSGVIAIGGKIESGILSVGDQLLVIPGNELCSIKGIRINGEVTQVATAGDNVDVGLVGIEPEHLICGSFLCDPEKPIAVASRIKAQIVTFSSPMPLICGVQVTLHTQSINEMASVTKLISIIDKKTGEVKKRRPRAIGDKSTAMIELTCNNKICVELYKQYQQLGRFTLRSQGRTIAAGIVVRIFK